MVTKSHYVYDPSLAVAAVAAALFGGCFLLNSAGLVRYKAAVCTILVSSVAMETAGYVMRCVSIQQPDVKSYFVAQFALTVLAPVMLAAFCYVIFGRIIYFVVPKEERSFRLLWVPPRFVTPIFVTCDIIALLFQLAGSVMVASATPGDPKATSQLNRAKTIAVIGIAIQMIGFSLFSVSAVRFHFTSSHISTNIVVDSCELGETPSNPSALPKSRAWRPLLRAVNIASALILVRTIYRLINFLEGPQGYLNTHEWSLYVFDALAMLPSMAIFVYWHPGKCLPHLGWRLPAHAR